MTQIFDELNLFNINHFDFIFTIVRNPIDRFISECNWGSNEIGVNATIDNYENECIIFCITINQVS